MHPFISRILSNVLYYSPTSRIHSWLLYFGIQTALPDSTQEFAPLRNICEYLNALHIYADEAKRGVVRHVEANHFCSHLSKDVRQCLLYDSAAKNARLIGVEYMVTKEIYETLDPEEQKLWHSHEFEVKSGMLVLPMPSSHASGPSEWEKLETEAMRQVIGLYGKTWHFWQIDRGDTLPLGYPRLMGSLTEPGQLNLDEVLKERNERHGIDMERKRRLRAGIQEPGVSGNADSWWKGIGPPSQG
ncbi:hypothetical protein GJ744_000953 [Endocarpon pusillum]|uniref:DUF1264 domain protein n=1 Tax=Endocarpon pusillum TaxID=364733 RepID=A0A8H7E100_9EURO|nr:hypothetical protein GJ744_000953 [Endocarpon pusillum]